MTRQDFERLLDMTLLDGVLTPQEQGVLIQRAGELGITPDELQVMIDAKMQEKQMDAQKEKNAAAQNQQLVSTIATAVQAGSKAAARPSKCPHCGAPLNSYSSTCPQCGEEIPDPSAKASGVDINKFSEMMSQAKTTDERSNVILYTAVPATKVGLLDFATFAIAHFKNLSSDANYSVDERIKLRSAWMAKILEIGQKADVVLKNDSEAKSTISRIVSEASGISASAKRNLMIHYGVKTVLFIAFLLFLYHFLFKNSDNGPFFMTIIFLVLTFFVWRKKVVTKFLPL